jgi:hypothetical protein
MWSLLPKFHLPKVAQDIKKRTFNEAYIAQSHSLLDKFDLDAGGFEIRQFSPVDC